jgi:hypothetical protein
VAIGNAPSVAQLNSQAAQIAGAFKSTAAQALTLQAYAVSLGQAGLTTLGFSAGDATQFLTMCNYMATLAQVYQGTATQGSLFNFSNALTALTGPY